MARHVWIDFGDHDVTVQDNALTLLPGEPVQVVVHAGDGVSSEALHGKLQLRALADAIRQQAAAGRSTTSHVPSNPKAETTTP